MQRIPRDRFGVVGALPLTANDLDAMVFPDANADERQAFLDGLKFFSTPHTAAEGAGIDSNQPFCQGCHRNAEELPRDTQLVTTSSPISRAGRSTPTNFRFTSLNPMSGPCPGPACKGGLAADRDETIDFRTGAIFHAIRLEPYLLATAVHHPDLEGQLRGLSERTAQARIALVHGDVSPKNILLGPSGPVFLDAECAWYGDPAFDAAFCLNHFLLKCVARPQWSDRFLGCYAAFSDAYLADVTWEPRAEIESRIASLLPGLFLARIDGKSPVEYITDERDKRMVRDTARPLIERPPAHLAEISTRWRRALALPQL